MVGVRMEWGEGDFIGLLNLNFALCFCNGSTQPKPLISTHHTNDRFALDN